MLTQFCRMGLPEWIEAALFAERLAKKRGEIPRGGLNAHRPIQLIELSGLLALLKLPSPTSTTRTGGLAEIIWEKSTPSGTRSSRWARRKVAKERHEAEQRELGLQEQAAARNAVIGDKLLRIARLIARYVHDDGGQTHSAARHRLYGPDRLFYRQAVDVAATARWVITGDGGLMPGPSRPSDAS